MTNTATVSSPTTDLNPGNNTSTVTVTPGTSADLSIVKTHLGTMLAGTNDTYRLVVTNNGPSDANNAKVTDTLPAGLSFVSYTAPAGWSCSASGQDITCTKTVFAFQASDTIDVVVSIASDVTGTITNTAHITADTPDPILSNNTSTDSSTATGAADLSITKSHTGTAVAGQNITYTVKVHNGGPSNSPGDIVVNDTLPAGMSFVSASGSGWYCAHSSNVDITCTLSAGIHAGADAPDITVVASIDASVLPGTLVNTAAVSGPLTDPDPTNNTTTDPTDVTTHANVSITKSVTGDNPVLAGQGTSFRLTATNDGPSDAAAVSVIDTLPAGMTAGTVTASGWSCATIGSQITCTRPVLAAGASSNIDVAVTVSPSVADNSLLTNNAEISTSTNGDDPSDNKAKATVTVHTSADMSLVKTHSPSSVNAGETLDWTLTATNNGPSDALKPITITDTIPDGLVYLSASNAWTCDYTAAPVLTCTLGQTLAPGEKATDLVVHTLVKSTAPAGPITNTADVTSQTPDPVIDNNHATDTVQVTTLADLAITKTHVGHGTIGGNTVFTLTVTNNGPSAADNIVVTDTLPAGLTFVSSTALDGAPFGDCTAVPGANNTSVVTCPFTGMLAPQGVVQVQVTVAVGSGAYPQVINTATVTSTTPDPVIDNNTTTDPLIVDPVADLAIVKAHVGSDTFVVGETRAYTLTVTNNGPTEDPGAVTVTDTLPTGLSYVSATGTGWSCAGSGQVVTCTWAGAYAAGATSQITLNVTVLPTAVGGLTNTATVMGTATDPVIENNTSTDSVNVLPLVDLRLTKKGSPVDANGHIIWTLSVSNGGPNIAPGPIVVTDPLPETLQYISFSGSGWVCAQAGQTVTCTYSADLGVNRVAPDLLLTTRVAPGTPAGTNITNTASVQLPNGVLVDTNHGNNTSTASQKVPAKPVTPSKPLAPTGADVVRFILMALVLGGVGIVMVVYSRRLRRN